MAAAATAGSAHALLVRDFANTIDHDKGVEVETLSSAADLARWLQERDLVAGGASARTADLELARRLRCGLRAMLLANDTEHAPPSELADAAAAGLAEDPLPPDLSAELPLRVELVDGAPRLVPGKGGVRGGLAALLVAVQESVADGSWPRLKICVADDCRWAFLDQSKNQSRTWCAMGVCGNRAKTRSYRARQKSLPGSADG